MQLSAEKVPQTFEGLAGSWEGSELLVWAGLVLIVSYSQALARAEPAEDTTSMEMPG